LYLELTVHVEVYEGMLIAYPLSPLCESDTMTNTLRADNNNKGAELHRMPENMHLRRKREKEGRLGG
jgi:hypothetical protein